MSTPFDLLDGGRPTHPDDELSVAEKTWPKLLGWLAAARDSGEFEAADNLADPDERRRLLQWLEDRGLLEKDMPTTPDIEAFARETKQTLPEMRMSAAEAVIGFALAITERDEEARRRTALFTDEDDEINMGHRPSTIGGTT